VQLSTRKVLNRAFTGVGFFSVFLMSATLVVLLGPIVLRGAGAFVFKGTVEYRRAMLELYAQGDEAEVRAEVAQAAEARQPVYEMLEQFEEDVAEMGRSERREYRRQLRDLQDVIRELLGPIPGEEIRPSVRMQYGQTRWDRVQVHLHKLMFRKEYDHSDPTKMGVQIDVPRVDSFRGTSAEPLFAHVEEHIEEMLLPRRTFYWRFLVDDEKGAYFFGGIGPAVLGTLYLTVGAMLFAGPMGILSAVYLTEYAKQNWFISLLRSCISTLAGVPSIVFGLFGLAFFINTLHVSASKSVLAGSMVLAVLVLPTVIRASEEAIKAVPHTYKEAALSLGATKWRTTFTVVLPAALPGVLTSIIISMGRAAGETAPIIFTAAVSSGVAPKLWEVFSEPTPALPWNIYNLCSEHAHVDEIRHVQYGMVLTLIALVLILNVTAIVLRARISRKLRG
jgi:phosphate transport system permease protein